MRQIGKYQIVEPHQEVLPEDWRPECIVLDTCVAIDLCDYYFGNRPVDRESLMKLLMEFPMNTTRSMTVDINYGWAASESSWRRDGTFSATGARELRHAVGEVLSWDRVRIEREFGNRNPPAARDRRWPTKVPLPSPDAIVHNFPFLAGIYASMLYIFHLERSRARWKQKGPLWAVDDLLCWMKDELGAVLVYELAIGIDMFVSKNDRRNSARTLLKIRGNEDPDEIADKAWNAAWDIWFVRLTEGRSYGFLPSSLPERTVLVTANKDPLYIRMVSELHTVIETSGEPYAFNICEWDETISAADVAELKKILAPDLLASQERLSRNPEEALLQVVGLVDKMEGSLGVSDRTLKGYQRSGERPFLNS